MQKELKEYLELQIGNQNKENEEKVYQKVLDKIKLELAKITEGKDMKEVLSELAITVNLETGEILNITNGKSTGKTYLECVENFAGLGDDVIMIDSKGKLNADCKDNVLCKECVEAINSSIVVGKSFSTVQEETLLDGILVLPEIVNLI
ncbi:MULTISPECIES: hypothetical protein [unclassified Wolbachia]|uniref:hypothetical protein n=1 Tax=unclassified Wolbachia TaxID=2640676 RepID=UPI0021F86B06|nr:hypothetical protein [Wolbachia endosymbiont (group B) of Erebia ligea]